MPRPPRPLHATLLVAVLIAGCAAPASDVAPAAAPPTIEIDADRPDTSFGDVVAGPAAAPDLDATTAAPPELVLGEWWKIRFTSPLFPDVPEFYRVVAAVEEEGYVVGMPHEGWFKESIAFHAPGFGDIGLDLSYDVHNERFEPVRFPLTKDATWETAFGIATVESVDEHTATIRFDAPESEPEASDPIFALLNPLGDLGTLRIVYDARQHEVVKFESAFATWEVIEHGYGFEGWVTVPRGLHTAIDYGQLLPVTPGGPVITRTQDIEGGYNRLTLMHGIFSFGPGVYRIRDVGPDGTEYVTESIAGQPFTLNFHEATDPDGLWQLEDIVAGPGGTYTMGMAYHQYDIRLPDGARRSDHSHPVVR